MTIYYNGNKTVKCALNPEISDNALIKTQKFLSKENKHISTKYYFSMEILT